MNSPTHTGARIIVISSVKHTLEQNYPRAVAIYLKTYLQRCCMASVLILHLKLESLLSKVSLGLHHLPVQFLGSLWEILHCHDRQRNDRQRVGAERHDGVHGQRFHDLQHMRILHVVGHIPQQQQPNSEQHDERSEPLLVLKHLDGFFYVDESLQSINSFRNRIVSCNWSIILYKMLQLVKNCRIRALVVMVSLQMQEGAAFASLPTEVAREVNDLIQNKNLTETVHGKALARSKPNMTDAERLNMADFLLQHSQGEARLPRAVISATADKFQVHRNTVSRIWNQMKAAMDAGASADVVMKQALSKKRGNCGRKKKDYSAALEKVKQLPLNKRKSLRALSTAVGVPRTTLFRLLKDDTDSNPTDTAACEHQETTSNEPKTIIANAIKPPLSDKNKRDRLRFCFSKMQPNGVFDDMYNVVHINTKWCLLPSSRNMKKTKVMFLVAVARPHWDNERQQHFDGKLGVWPFVEADPGVSVLPWDQAAPHGGRAIRALETITKKEIQTMVTNYVIPAIKMKIPRAQHNRPLFIQLDNLQVRLTADDHLVAEHGREDGWDIRVQHQPAYSPELVVLTYNFMKTIYPDMMQVRNSTMQLTPIEELIATVEHSFAALPKRQINDAFLALQKTMECIMLAKGSNDFDSKEDATKKSLQHDGSLPVSVLCSREALSACQSALNLPQE